MALTDARIDADREVVPKNTGLAHAERFRHRDRFLRRQVA
jgi:hypothetical protein